LIARDLLEGNAFEFSTSPVAAEFFAT